MERPVLLSRTIRIIREFEESWLNRFDPFDMPAITLLEHLRAPHPRSAPAGGLSGSLAGGIQNFLTQDDA